MDNWVALERKYCESWEKPSDVFWMASLMGKSKGAAVAIRIRYLRERLKELKDCELSQIWRANYKNEIALLQKKIMKPMIKPQSRSISEEMIEQARKFPIAKLVDFSSGKALAFCHMDKNPSLHNNKNKNTAHCFVCNKSFDAIAILMERDGFSFYDAVRKLCE